MIDYAAQEFRRQLRIALNDVSAKLARMRQPNAQIRTRLRRLARGCNRAGAFSFFLEDVTERGREHREMTDRFLSGGN